MKIVFKRTNGKEYECLFPSKLPFTAERVEDARDRIAFKMVKTEWLRNGKAKDLGEILHLAEKEKSEFDLEMETVKKDLEFYSVEFFKKDVLEKKNLFKIESL